MPNLDTSTLQLILVALVALALLAQAVVLLAFFIVLRKLAKSILEEIQELRSSVTPVVDKTRDLLTRVAPKVEETATDLAALTRTLRSQAVDMQTAADEIVARVRRQTSRVDTMLSSVLDAVDRAGVFMAGTITKPMRQLSAFLASAKAFVESLRSAKDAPRKAVNRAPDDSDPSA
jgi:methyl-accepting chemotaxis protein